MKRMYNTGHRWLDTFDPVSQDDILNCPEFFAMSLDEILNSGKCPLFLKEILQKFPWSGRPNVIQVKPQDFRKGKPKVLGEGIHLDNSVRLKDGQPRFAENLDDFRLLSVSFGDVVETEFVKTPLERESLDDNVINIVEFFQSLPNNLKFHSPAPNQLAEYTSLDLHRMSTNWKPGNARLLIIAFECNKPMPTGAILPSITDRENTDLKFEDYNT